MVSIESSRGEIWRKLCIDGTDTFVSSLGNVVNKRGIRLKPMDNGAGYLSAGIMVKNQAGKSMCKRVYLHRLVAMAFLPNPLNLPQVNHKDCDKSNNTLENLEWISGRNNILDAHAKGRMIKRTTNASINVLTKEQVIDLYTAVVRDNKGISAKAREMGISRTTASSIINKRSRWDITDLLDKEFNNDSKRAD